MRATLRAHRLRTRPPVFRAADVPVRSGYRAHFRPGHGPDEVGLQLRAATSCASLRFEFLLEAPARLRLNSIARAHGMWTHEPRQGRKAATAVCSASAVVTLAWLISDGPRAAGMNATPRGAIQKLAGNTTQSRICPTRS